MRPGELPVDDAPSLAAAEARLELERFRRSCSVVLAVMGAGLAAAAVGLGELLSGPLAYAVAGVGGGVGGGVLGCLLSGPARAARGRWQDRRYRRAVDTLAAGPEPPGA